MTPVPVHVRVGDEGHPDKDVRPDLRRDPGRHPGRGPERSRRLRDRHDDRPVLVAGEVTTSTYVDFQAVVRDTVKGDSANECRLRFDYLTCGTLVSVKEQSPDIAIVSTTHSRRGRRQVCLGGA